MKSKLFLVTALALTLVSCSRSLVDVGYKPTDQYGLDMMSPRSSTGTVHLSRISYQNFTHNNHPGSGIGSMTTFYDVATGSPIQKVDQAYYYPQESIIYEYNKQWAKVAAKVVAPTAQEPTIDLYVFDTLGDSLVFYGGTEQMVPRAKNEKTGKWTFKGEVALTPTAKDKVKQRERYMKYKLTFSPDASYPRVQSYKVKTRKVQ